MVELTHEFGGWSGDSNSSPQVADAERTHDEKSVFMARA